MRPAAVLLVPPGAIGAGLVEQALPDVLQGRMWPIEPEPIRLLDFDEDVTRNFGKSALLDRQPRSADGSGIGQHRVP